ncbi:MAG: hypothetical protein IPM42_00035 [Saprospiraceae bacterium]|nr:hypothetical protein [Saprospiraceae bacterium]
MDHKLYPGGKIKDKEWDQIADPVYSRLIVSLIEDLYRIMKIDNIKIPEADRFKSFMLGHKIGFNIDQELEFLTIPSEIERQLYIISHLEQLMPIVRQAEELRKRAELNGHFQSPFTPEF